MQNSHSDTRQSPWMFSKQVSSKNESFSHISEVSEESGRQMIDIRQKQSTRSNIRQPRFMQSDQISSSKNSVQSDSSKFGMRTLRHTSKTFVAQNLIKTMKTERIKKQFIKNLFHCSYILPENKKQLIRDKYIKVENKQVYQENEAYSQIPLFSPTSKFIIFWDAIGVLFNFIILWLTPFRLAFSEDQAQFFVLQYLIAIFLVIDIFLTLNKGIIVQGIVIKKRKQVILQYLKTNAFNDIANLIFWLFISQGYTRCYIFGELCTICQILACYCKIQKYFSDYFQYVFFKGTSNYLMDLLSLICSIYFFAHIVACFFCYVGESSEDVSWIKKLDVENQSCWKQYNYAFYWATMTMTTVGYGDVTPQSQLEITYVNIVMFLSSGIFAYSMNSIGLILKNINDAKLKYKRSLLQMNKYMSKNTVAPQIQSRIRNYIKYYIESEQNENLEDINRLISILPTNLQLELKSEISMKVINNIKIITNNFSKATQLLLSKNLELVKFTPGDVIHSKGDILDKNLYYILEGEVEIQDESSKLKFSQLQQTQLFGTYQFFTDFAPKTTAISKGFTNIYKISRKQFIEILQFNKKDFEKFHQMKDQIIFNSDYKSLELQCQFCDRSNHLEIDCPLLTYKPDLEQRLKKQQFLEQFNYRNQFKRNGIKIKSIQKQRDIAKFIKQYHEDNQGAEFTNSLQLAIISHRSRSNNYSEINNEHIKSARLAFELEEQKQGESINKASIKPDIQEAEHITKKTINDLATGIIKDFCMLDEFCQNQKLLSQIQTDQQQQYENYFPQGNLDRILKEYDKKNNKYQRRLMIYLLNFNKYTFFYRVKVKAFKLRQAYLKMLHDI